MAKRKIVLLVVEGTSDASLLVPAFSALIENRLFQGAYPRVCGVGRAMPAKDLSLLRLIPACAG